MTVKKRFELKDLYYGFTEAKPVDHEWDYEQQGYGWDYAEAVECDKCGKVVVGVYGEEMHCDLETDTDCDGYLYSEGPMMCYYYPVDVDRIGSAEEAAMLLVDLPVCVISFYEEGYEAGYALALTGGGMDLSWEICEAYVRLGYLPPTHFAHLPEYAGKELGESEQLVIGATRKALMGQKAQAERDLERLDQLEQSMPKAQTCELGC